MLIQRPNSRYQKSRSPDDGRPQTVMPEIREKYNDEETPIKTGYMNLLAK